MSIFDAWLIKDVLSWRGPLLPGSQVGPSNDKINLLQLHRACTEGSANVVLTTRCARRTNDGKCWMHISRKSTAQDVMDFLPIARWGQLTGLLMPPVRDMFHSMWTEWINREGVADQRYLQQTLNSSRHSECLSTFHIKPFRYLCQEHSYELCWYLLA